MCGNQAITLAIRAKANPSPDLSDEIWQQLEPIVEQKCGTAKNPTDILATNDYVRIDDVWQTSLRDNFDSPTLSSTKMDGTHKNGIARPDEDVPNYLDQRSGMGKCPFISETAGYLTGDYKTKWRSNGWYYGERGGRGTRGTYCAIYPSQDGETRWHRKGLKDEIFIYLSFEPELPYREDKSLLAGDLAAEAHANESRRAPYARKYHGFGAIRDRLDEPKRSVQWLCRNYLLTIDFTTRFSDRKFTNAEMWEVAEPAVNYFCKPINFPTKLAGDNHQLRIDHTKKLMKDWKMWSDNPRSGEPYNKSYVDPHDQYRRR